MVSADPNDYPDLVAPGLRALLETHIDSNMCHHSYKNKQTDDKVYFENVNLRVWNCYEQTVFILNTTKSDKIFQI
jgi:hypothetical protein